MLYPFKVVLTSQSEIKTHCVENVLRSVPWKEHSIFDLKCFKVDHDAQVAQPIDDGGLLMARNRIKYLLDREEEVREADLIISIENFMIQDSMADYCCIIFYFPKEPIEYVRYAYCGTTYDSSAFQEMMLTYDSKKHGCTTTLGEILSQKFDVPSNNWTGYSSRCCGNGFNREEVIMVLLENMSKEVVADQLILKKIKKSFRFFPDFPKPGVNFKDWNDLFLNHELVDYLAEYMAKKYMDKTLPLLHEHHTSDLSSIKTVDLLQRRKTHNIDYVIGLETRGFLIGMILAQKLKCGFIPMRKVGKIAGERVTESYEKEYGSDTLELRSDLPSGKVLLVDDVLATGGSMKTAINLARKAGHHVVDCILVTDVAPLREIASQKLKNDPIRVLLADW